METRRQHTGGGGGGEVAGVSMYEDQGPSAGIRSHKRA